LDRAAEFLLRRKNSPKALRTAAATSPPMMAPAITPLPAPTAGEVCADGGEAVKDGLCEDCVRVLVVDAVRVRVLERVLEGLPAPRHVVSAVAPTVLISEAPPCRPRASIMTKTREVPAGTFAVQSYDEDPRGGLSTNDGPPGLSPIIVIGCTALS